MPKKIKIEVYNNNNNVPKKIAPSKPIITVIT